MGLFCLQFPLLFLCGRQSARIRSARRSTRARLSAANCAAFLLHTLSTGAPQHCASALRLSTAPQHCASRLSQLSSGRPTRRICSHLGAKQAREPQTRTRDRLGVSAGSLAGTMSSVRRLASGPCHEMLACRLPSISGRVFSLSCCSLLATSAARARRKKMANPQCNPGESCAIVCVSSGLFGLPVDSPLSLMDLPLHTWRFHFLFLQSSPMGAYGCLWATLELWANWQRSAFGHPFGRRLSMGAARFTLKGT